MSSSYQSKLWKIGLPDGWKARGGGGTDGEAHTVWHPEGVGTLTIFYHSELGAPPRSNTGMDYSGSVPGYFRKADDGSPNHNWRLLCGGRWLWVRYSSSLPPEEWESSGVEQIVASLSEHIQQGDGPNEDSAIAPSS